MIHFLIPFKRYCIQMILHRQKAHTKQRKADSEFVAPEQPLKIFYAVLNNKAVNIYGIGNLAFSLPEDSILTRLE